MRNEVCGRCPTSPLNDDLLYLIMDHEIPPAWIIDDENSDTCDDRPCLYAPTPTDHPLEDLEESDEKDGGTVIIIDL